MKKSSINKGDIIWRHVYPKNGHMVMAHYKFKKNARGPGIMFRALSPERGKSFTIGREWTVSNGDVGLICICKERVPDNWSGFVVSEVKRGMALVSPVTGNPNDLLIRYHAPRDISILRRALR